MYPFVYWNVVLVSAWCKCLHVCIRKFMHVCLCSIHVCVLAYVYCMCAHVHWQVLTIYTMQGLDEASNINFDSTFEGNRSKLC